MNSYTYPLFLIAATLIIVVVGGLAIDDIQRKIDVANARSDLRAAGLQRVIDELEESNAAFADALAMLAVSLEETKKQ